MRWSRGTQFVVVLATCSVLGSGCSSGKSKSDEPTPSAESTSSSPATTPTPGETVTPTEPPVQQAINAEPVPPNALEVRAKLPLVEGDERASVLAVDEAGTVLRTRSPGDQSLELPKVELALRDPAGNETKFASPSGPAQVSGAAFNERYVVWMETPSTDLMTDPWVLYRYDRAEDSVQELAHAPRLGAAPPPPVPGYTGPVLAGDRVFWAQAGGTPKALTSDIMGCQVTDCSPQTVIPGAAYPTAADGKVYAIAHNRFTGGEVEAPQMTIQAVPSTQGGGVVEVKTVELTPTQFPNGLAASDTGLVWLISDSADKDQAHVWYTDAETVLTVESELSGQFAYPIAADTYMAWAEGTGTADAANFLMDRSGALYSLGTTGSLYGLDGAGDIVVWREETKPGGGTDATNIEFTVAQLHLP